MVLRFPFWQVPLSHLAAPLGGQKTRLRPMVHVTAIGPAGTVVRHALLDTGSDDTMFRDNDAARLGIDLTNAPSGIMGGVGSPPYPVRYAPLKLRLTDGIVYREWPALVGFTPARLNRVLLGFTGCLQFFTTTFHSDRAEVELAVNPLYPGT
jgi:hypothetical protein